MLCGTLEKKSLTNDGDIPLRFGDEVDNDGDDDDNDGGHDDDESDDVVCM